MTLKGRGIIVTGASQGLGFAVARACIAEGAHVLICARNAAEVASARTELQNGAGADQRVAAVPADVSRAEDVARLFETAKRELPGIDGLVNNAGVYGPKGTLETVDAMEWWRAIEINLLGVVLCCQAVLPLFRAAGRGKIVNISGGGATAPLPGISAYAASKAAVVRLTETLAHETAGTGIDINAVAPGALNTRLLDEVIAAGPGRVGETFYQRSLQQREKGGTPLEKGASLCVYLLSSAGDGISGRLISAVWDPWSTLASRREELNGTDIYTLRRIVPEDRGRKWE